MNLYYCIQVGCVSYQEAAVEAHDEQEVRKMFNAWINQHGSNKEYSLRVIPVPNTKVTREMLRNWNPRLDILEVPATRYVWHMAEDRW